MITAKENGLITLVAPRVENHGVILAQLGKIELAAADTFTLDMAGDGLIQVAVSEDEARKLAANTGILAAEGGVVALTASKARTLVDSLVENSGVIEAASMHKRGGKIILGSSGITVNSGILDASGRKHKVKGGQIEVLGQHVVLTAGSLVDASGTAEGPVNRNVAGSATMTIDKTVRSEEDFLVDERRGGGSIKIGGDYLGTGDTQTAKTLYVDENALTLNSGLTHGDGGRTIFWSDDTTDFNGLVIAQGGAQSGHGGFLETSGKINLKASGVGILTAQEKGYNKGTYLLDPADITIYGNFTPDDVANLELWVDASDTTTITETAGVVSSVQDKANGHSFGLFGGGVIRTGDSTFNGLNVFDMDGTAGLNATGVDLEQGITIFSLARSNNSTYNANGTLGAARDDGNGFILHPGIGSSDVFFYNVNGSGAHEYMGTLNYGDASDFNLTQLGLSTSQSYYGRNGSITTGAGQSRSTTAISNNVTIGSDDRCCTRFLDGEYAEFILFNDYLDTNSRNLVEQYQSAKWNIALDPIAGAGTEAAEAMDTTNGFGAFTTRYLERLSSTADIVLQADNSITLDLDGDTLSLDAGRSISLTTTNGNITDVSAGTVRTDNGNISLNAGGAGNIDLDTTNLEALNGGIVNLEAGGDIDLVQSSALNLGRVNGQNISIDVANTMTGNDVLSTNGGNIVLDATGDLDMSAASLVTENGNINLSGTDVALNSSMNAGTGEITVTATQDIFINNTDVSAGLVGYWNFDEGAGLTSADSVGSNDGDLLGGASWSTETPFNTGYSIDFDGVDDLVDIGNTGLGAQEKSLNLWLNPASLTNDMRIISNTDNTSFSIRFNGTGIDVWGNNWQTVIPVAGNTNTWTNYTFNFDGTGSVSGYINHNAALTQTINENWSNIGIGDELNNAWGSHFDGQIDDVRIYNKMLSTLEISQLANPVWTSGSTVLNAARDVTLGANTSINASDAGNAIVVNADRNFVNNASSSVLNASDASGRWLVYSSDPDDNTLNGLSSDFKRYNRTYAGYAPASVTETGHGLLYDIAPTVTVTANSTTRTYGDANPVFGYSVTGFIDGDTIATTDAVSGSAAISTTAGLGSNVGSYTITAAPGTLASDIGYQFSYANGTFDITQANLEVVADDFTFSQGTPVAETYTFTGFKNGETFGTSGITGAATLNIGNLAALSAGIYDLDLDLSGLSAINYSFSEKLPKGQLVIDDTNSVNDLPNSVQKTTADPTIQLNASLAPSTMLVSSEPFNDDGLADIDTEEIDAGRARQTFNVEDNDIISNKTISADFIEIDKTTIDFYDLCSYNPSYCQ